MEDDKMSTLNERLRELRKSRDVTQQELADYLKIGKTTISNYETGYSSPDNETLSELAKFFNVSVDYLLGRTDIKNPVDEITNTLKDDKELADFWNELKEREDLQLLFKQTKNLSPKDIKQIIRIIKAIEEEEDRENE